ncbi:MAG TPA: glycosyltransferase family 2 protein [Dehalococcoidia bacterium]|nr:glycosyltransferase family 2 protein [Dehalococcoidia bacterium]
MRDEAPPVAAVVLTWNNFSDTDECLRSVANLHYQRLSVVVVDNGSTDSSAERLEGVWGGRAKFVRNHANLGVAAGYNAGIREALAQGAEYVLLLNNDVVVDPGLLDALLPAFEAEPRLGTISPLITYYENRERLWFAGAVYNRFLGLARHVYLSRPVTAASKRLGRLFESDYVPNCSALTPAEAFRRAGLLDEAFFLGLEDIDWCLRLRSLGYRIRVCGRPLTAHKVSASAGFRGSNVLSPAQAYHYARGSILLGRRWSPGIRFVPYFAGQLLVRFPYYSLQMAIHGRPRGIPSYLRGLWDGFRLYVLEGKTSAPPPAPA